MGPMLALWGLLAPVLLWLVLLLGQMELQPPVHQSSQGSTGQEEAAGGILRFAFGNPSTWGPVARRAVEGSDAQVWGTAEAHLVKDELKKLETKGVKNRNVFGSPADYIGRGSTAEAKAKSTHGGVLVMPERQMAAYSVAGAKGSEGREEACGIGRHWVACEAKATPLLLFMVAYMEASVGANATNMTRLMSMVTYAKARGKFLVCAADWNMSPTVLQATGILEEAELAIVTPADVDCTCTTGNLLDYFVVSRALRPAVRCRTLPTPWGRHTSVVLDISLCLKQFVFPGLWKPKAFEDYDLSKVDEEEWRIAMRKARNGLAGRKGLVPGLAVTNQGNAIQRGLW